MENGQGGNQATNANESAMDEQARNLRRALPSERELIRDNMKSKAFLFSFIVYPSLFALRLLLLLIRRQRVFVFSFFYSGKPARAAESASSDHYQPCYQQVDR